MDENKSANRGLLAGIFIAFIVIVGGVGYLRYRQDHQGNIATTIPPVVNNVVTQTTPTVVASTTTVNAATTATSTVKQIQTKTFTITLSDIGFSPAFIQINNGDTVKFVNKSSNAMRVASNPHPTHTDYPGFDELKNGDTYTFTFTRVGSWGYHNHVDPTVQGRVVVK